MSIEEVRVDDPFRDTVGDPLNPNAQTTSDVLELASDEVPLTDDAPFTKVKTYTVAAEGAAVALTATSAVTIDEDAGTVTSVTYTPAGAQAAPTSGNSRTWLVQQGANTIASYTFGNLSPAFVSGTPVAFALGTTAVTEGQLTLASSVVGTGAADPGGTLTVTYTS